MKLVVPLTMPWMRSMGVAESDSSSTRTTGTAPATAASKRSRTPCAAAVSNSSSPCRESSSLLALTTSLPDRIAASRCSRAGSTPPISSTSRSAPARISSKCPRVRVSTPLMTGRRPLKRSISPARSSSSRVKAEPTVPCPSSPTRKGVVTALEPCACALADIARGQVLEALAPDDHAGVPLAAKDHRRARHAVVVVGHRVAVGAGCRDHHDVAGTRLGQPRFAHHHIPGLAVLSREHAFVGPVEAIGDVRLIDGAVEHRTQVVGHAAVDGDPARDVLLDALDG